MSNEQPQSNALAVIGEYLGKHQDQIGKVLRQGDTRLDPTRMVRLAFMAVTRNPKLQECHPATILNSLMVGAALGLDPTLTTGKFFLVPRWNSKMRCQECTPLIGYKGLVELAFRHPRVMAINPQLVFAGEEFEIDPTHPTKPIRHRPAFDIEKTSETLVHAYALCWLKGSRSPIWECLSKRDIEGRKARSSSKKGGESVGPWVTDYLPMARKSALRALIQGGTVPTREEMSLLSVVEQAVDEEQDMRRLQNLGMEPPSGAAEEPMATGEVTSVEHTEVPADRQKAAIEPRAVAEAAWLRACEAHSLNPDDAQELVRRAGGSWATFDRKKCDPDYLLAVSEMLLERQQR